MALPIKNNKGWLCDEMYVAGFGMKVPQEPEQCSAPFEEKCIKKENPPCVITIDEVSAMFLCTIWSNGWHIVSVE
jgi:hypothetical protein